MVVDTLNFDSGVTSLAFDNRRIVIAAGAKEVKMYNRSTGTFSALGEEVDGGWSGHGKAVRSVQLIGGERVVSGGMDGLVKFWNI